MPVLARLRPRWAVFLSNLRGGDQISPPSLHFFMRRVLPAETAIFVSLDAIGIVLLVLHGGIIALLTD
jgi:hypothetical protein